MSKKREERKRKRLEQEKKEKWKKFSRVFYLEKKVGETPLEILENFQRTKKFKKWQNEAVEICKKRKVKKKGCSKIPLAYAGRLDPMAHGKMLILAGEACKEREKYLGLDKEYIFEVLIGFSSDSQDILGIVKADKKNTRVLNSLDTPKIEKKLKKILKNFKGKRKMKYPVFSSKAVKGKPLFLWALEKRLGEIEIPEKEIEIYNIKKVGSKVISSSELKKEVFRKIKSLKKVKQESKKLGEDFRRVAVLESWEKSFKNFPPESKFLILKVKATVSSGTYMRNLASEIGRELGFESLALSIKRTKIGKVKKILELNFFKNII